MAAAQDTVGAVHEQHSNDGVRLTQAALEAHTVRHPPSSRSNVETFLRQSLPFVGQFDSVGVTPLSPTKAVAPHVSTARKRDCPETRERINNENCALVLHSDLADHEASKRKSRKLDHSDPTSKKQSLVKAMKPRASVQHVSSSRPKSKTRDSSREVKVNKTELRREPRASASSALALNNVFADEPSPRQQGEGDGSSAHGRTRMSRRAHQLKEAADSADGPREAQSKHKSEHESPGGQQKDARCESSELDQEDSDGPEDYQRRAARRERRRAKALIVKDKTLSAAETGRLAARKLSKRRSTIAEDDDASNNGDERKNTKRKRPRATTKAVWQLQEQQRPKGIQQGRLTLKPTVKLGVFSKGVAGARTRASASQDKTLAFSEIEFLDRAQNAMHSDSSGSREDSATPPKVESAKNQMTYGSRSRKISSWQGTILQETAFERSETRDEHDAAQGGTRARLRGPSTKSPSRRSERLRRAETLHRAHTSSSLLSSLPRTLAVDRRLANRNQKQRTAASEGLEGSQSRQNSMVELDTSRFFGRSTNGRVHMQADGFSHHDALHRYSDPITNDIHRMTTQACSCAGMSTSSICRMLAACEAGLASQFGPSDPESLAMHVDLAASGSEGLNDRDGKDRPDFQDGAQIPTTSPIDTFVGASSDVNGQSDERDGFQRGLFNSVDGSSERQRWIDVEARRDEHGRDESVDEMRDDQDEFRKAMSAFWYRTVL
ncbi:hypothetical protein OIV83_001046 [Microbotryomycetes sp. JL201]|nr:hypothetical protein OIV83_001046 [Microbotryomycetes sp. JL201]